MVYLKVCKRRKSISSRRNIMCKGMEGLGKQEVVQLEGLDPVEEVGGP